MLKARAGPEAIILGLTNTNVARLLSDQPIKFCLSELGHPPKTMGICHGNAEVLYTIGLPSTHKAPVTAELGNGTFLLVLPDAALDKLVSGKPIQLDVSAAGLLVKALAVIHGLTEKAIAHSLGTKADMETVGSC